MLKAFVVLCTDFERSKSQSRECLSIQRSEVAFIRLNEN